MMILLLLFNSLLEGVFYLFYPIWYLLLKSKGYLGALNSEGEDIHKGILFHAASMGEVAAVMPLILKICAQKPKIEIGITTSTVTGLKMARQISPGVKAWLSAIDTLNLRNKQLRKINPGLICIVETEIWPNMLAYAARKRIPVIFLNARLSERSLSRYRLIKVLLSELGKPVRKIAAQSDEDAKRFAKLFNRPIINAGNLKFCLGLKDYPASQLRTEWGFSQNDLILCFGSSRPGEEALILSVWSELANQYANLKLIIAIRHPKRIEELKELFSAYPSRFYSAISQISDAKPILVIDSLGVLDKAYAICDIAIVGGSFYNFGGHNPLEPAFYSKAIIMGPYYHSCRDSVNKLNVGGGIILSNKDLLKQDLLALISEPAKRTELGINAKKVLTENAQALDIHYNEVMKIMGEKE